MQKITLKLLVIKNKCLPLHCWNEPTTDGAVTPTIKIKAMVYVFSIHFLNKESNIDYAIVEGVYTDKEAAKQAAIKKCKEQQAFWDGSIAYKEFGKNTEDFCNVVLERPDGVRKRYRIEAKELQ